MNKPAIIHICFCPEHGPYVETAYEDGCPEQVDYDGITCGTNDNDPTPYYLDNNL